MSQSKKDLKSLAEFGKAARVFEEFVSSQAFGGVLLIICTVVALFWANGPAAGHYFSINYAKAGFVAGHFSIYKSLQHWVNDGLMAIFFLLVGLEIKREILTGELSAWNKAVLPIIAAFGGMLVPALVFVAINFHDGHMLRGWAIPMATDIAFALGILSILSKRIPRSLIVLLTAIAIVDDLGAVIVIAIFYTDTIVWAYLILAAVSLLILVMMNCYRVRKLWPYLFIGVMLWYALLQSGVHATIAGVLLAFTIPSESHYKPNEMAKRLYQLTSLFGAVNDKTQLAKEDREGLLQAIENMIHTVETPLQRLEHALHVPVTYLIMPLFVLFNAGVSFSGANLHGAITHTLTIGIILGLVVGKCLGVFGASVIAVKTGLAKLPKQVGLMHMLSLSLIAGVGFTMSIFIAELAFDSAEHLMMAKLGIMCASLVAAILGYASMFWVSRK